MMVMRARPPRRWPLSSFHLRGFGVALLTAMILGVGAPAAAPLLIPPGILPGSKTSGDAKPVPANPQPAAANPSGAALPPLLPADEHMKLWKTLARVTKVPGDAGDEPDFHSSIRALVDTEIEITGYMMPLKTGDRQKHFLLSPFPHDCPFCATLGPESLLEVFCTTPLKMTFKAVTLTGRFHLAGIYADNGVYYRLTEAALAAEY